jgi:hypothetical protein
MSDAEEEIDKLFKGAVTPEERKELWAAFLECVYQISDDEEWARFRKLLDEVIAKRSAH